MSARRVYNFPGWQDNAYVRLLQEQAVERGWELGGAAGLAGDRLMTAALEELTDPHAEGVVHIQWLSPVTEEADDERSAFRRADLFGDAVFTAARWGRPVLWTIHNALPHDAKYPRAAKKLQEAIARHADRVHVLSEAGAELARRDFAVPADRIAVIPHSSYGDVYGPRMECDEARRAIGIDGSRPAALFFGWIRPYKGLATLADGLEAARAAGNGIDLLLAGRPKDDVDGVIDRLRAAATRTVEHLGRVADADVPAWFGAADVLVLPYERILNSGTLYLAAAYGLPTILPDEPHLVDEFGGEEWIRFFDRRDRGPSLSALLQDEWYRESGARDAALAFAGRRPPSAMSGAYADLLERLSH